ncbi:MAG: histidine phosphatase family protein [Gammaproteobacteria bacterium]
MKRLILLRHAKSSWSAEGLADFERPLSGRGERDAPLMAARLRERSIRPTLVLSSPALRARRTAELVAAEFDDFDEGIKLDARLYLATPAEILAVVVEQVDELDCLLVVGHNPGLTELSNLLLPGLDLENLPTAGVVVSDFAAERWAEIRSAGRRLFYYDYPKNAGGTATTD